MFLYANLVNGYSPNWFISNNYVSLIGFVRFYALNLIWVFPEFTWVCDSLFIDWWSVILKFLCYYILHRSLHESMKMKAGKIFLLLLCLNVITVGVVKKLPFVFCSLHLFFFWINITALYLYFCKFIILFWGWFILLADC